MQKSDKFQFSKFLTFSSLCLFIWSLLQGFSTDFTQVYDTTVYVTAITISGGIFGVCLKSYMGKSKAENVYKIQKTIYEEIMNVKLQYNEAMMKLIQTYHLTQDNINMFDSDSPINDGVNDILNDMRENVNNHLYDVKSEDDIEHF